MIFTGKSQLNQLKTKTIIWILNMAFNWNDQDLLPPYRIKYLFEKRL